MRYCDDALRDEVKGYINAITETINNKKYTNALEQMKQAKTSNDFLIAAEFFEEIKDYRDSGSLAKECWKKKEHYQEEEEEELERQRMKEKEKQQKKKLLTEKLTILESKLNKEEKNNNVCSALMFIFLYVGGVYTLIAMIAEKWVLSVCIICGILVIETEIGRAHV